MKEEEKKIDNFQDKRSSLECRSTKVSDFLCTFHLTVKEILRPKIP
jgi:hypothetical protein